MGSLKINIFKVHFWGREGVTKKEYSVYVFNVDNSGRPLNVALNKTIYTWYLAGII